MSILLIILLGILPLAEKVPDPEDVKAGWAAFAIFLALAAAVVFLAFSLRKHLKKVNFDEDADSNGPSNGPSNGTP